MRRIFSLLALALMTACGGTAGPYGSMPTTTPITVIEERPVHPVKEMMPVIGLGQSIIAYGTESHGVGQQFARRLQADNPNKDVQYFQAAIGEQSVTEMHSGGVVAEKLALVYTASIPAAHLLVNQGQADRNMDSKKWVNNWGFTLQEMKNKGYISTDTTITFGEMLHNNSGDARNADLPEIATRFEANIATAEGIPTIDGVHPTPVGLNMLGNRYYEAATKVKP